jgi:hypothetical protein
MASELAHAVFVSQIGDARNGYTTNKCVSQIADLDLNKCLIKGLMALEIVGKWS